MKSQWECFLQNLGEWQGSFTQVSPTGELLEETPSILWLEGLNDNQTVKLTLRRFSPEPRELVQHHTSLSRSILFFETGAFSKGAMQLAPRVDFGAEFGLVWGDRRLRAVKLFDANHALQSLTLIREQRAGRDAPERSPLQIDDLVGEWQGEATTLTPDWFVQTMATQLRVDRVGDRVQQTLRFGTGTQQQEITTSAEIRDRVLRFDSGAQVLLLPDGASFNCPVQFQFGQPLLLEIGWLVEANLRQRIIRRYNEKGEWLGAILVSERRVA